MDNNVNNTPNTIHCSTHQQEAMIQHDGDIMQLIFASEPDAIQSAINAKKPHQLEMNNLQYLMGVLLFIPPPEKILLLGVGAGSLVHFFRHSLPDSHITAVDFDQQLLDFAQQKMMLPEADEKLHYIIQDARQYIEQCQQQYDLIIIDIFDGSQSPEWTRNDAFTCQLKSCLTQKGAVAYNTLIQSEVVFEDFYKRLTKTFNGQTLYLETDDYENLLLYALNFSPEIKSMMQNLEQAQKISLKYNIPFNQILSVIYNTNPVDSGII